MRAGRLRHRITVQRNDGTAAASGQVIASWTTWLTREPAEVIETGGAEQLRGHTIDATATHLVIVRYRTGWHEQLRILHGTRVLGIDNVRDPDGRGRELWATCKEVKP